MKWLRPLSLLGIGLLLSSCQQHNIENTPAQQADLILKNAKVYTLNPQQNWAEAVAIKDGKIIYVGNDKGASDYLAKTTQVSDLNGQMLLPAFQDAHIHPVTGGIAYSHCPLFNIKTLQEVLAKIRSCMVADPEMPYLSIKGWSWEIFNQQAPNKELLDAIDNKRPIIAKDTDGHTLWVNSAALAFANITAKTADPEGGVISRNKSTGEPTGTLLEGPAMNLILKKLPEPSIEMEMEALRYTQGYLHSLGITAMQDAYTDISSSNPEKTLTAYTKLRDNGELKLRVSAAIGWNPGAGVAQVENIIKARNKFSGGRLQANTVKFWADGIIESRTAFMLEPYSDQPDNRGLLMVPLEEIQQGTQLLDAAGFQLHIHAIGDATVRMALDVLAAARKHNGPRDSRHLTAHTQLVHPDDIARFGQLDVIAGFSPYWFYADEYVSKINPPQLGPVRMGWMYPINSIQQTGGRYSFGSDWSVSTADPLLGIETAVTRISPHQGDNTPPLIPSERINLHQAIAGYTLHAAYANFLDQTTGSIEVGKYADLVVLKDNLFAIPAADISESKVTATLMEGELVYGQL